MPKRRKRNGLAWARPKAVMAAIRRARRVQDVDAIAMKWQRLYYDDRYAGDVMRAAEERAQELRMKRKGNRKKAARRKNVQRVSSLVKSRIRRKVKASAKRRRNRSTARLRRLSVGSCRLCGGGHSLRDGICRSCRAKLARQKASSRRNPRRARKTRKVTVPDRRVAAALVRTLRKMGYKARLVTK